MWGEQEWLELLIPWNRKLLEDEDIVAQLPVEVRASGWLGFPGAGVEELARAESRLGVSLPSSYRSFLQVTNGWYAINAFIYRLWSTTEIEWHRTRHQDLIDAWQAGERSQVPQPPPVSDEEYLVYGVDQRPTAFRSTYLHTAIEASDIGDDAQLLLNPRVITQEGEWEAWFFASWRLGAERYRSFQDLMVALYRRYQQARGDS